MKINVCLLSILTIVILLSATSCSEDSSNNPFVSTNYSNNAERNIKCDAVITPTPNPLTDCSPLTVNLVCNADYNGQVQSYYWEKSDYCNNVIQTWNTTTNTLTDTIEHSYDYCGRGIFHYKCTVTYTDSTILVSDPIDAYAIPEKTITFAKVSQSYTADQITNEYELGIRPDLELKLNRDITLDLSESLPDCNMPSVKRYMYYWYGQPGDAFEDPDYELGTWQSSPIFTFRKISNNYRASLVVRTLSWDGGISEFIYWHVQ